MKKLLAALVALITTSSAAYADITIGLAGPLSGSYATIGDQMLQGAEWAVTDINASGGVNGEKLVLEKGDDACDPKQAVMVANQMVNKNVKFVVGHGCSGSSIPASKIYDEENVLMVSPVSSSPALTNAGLHNVFRTCGRDDEESAIQAAYVLKHFRDKKIAIVHDRAAVDLDLAEQFKKNLNIEGMQEVLFDSYTPGEKDYSALVTKLKQAGVQILIVEGYHVETGLIARQIKEQNAAIQIIGDDALMTQEFWNITGPAGEGILMTSMPDGSKYPEAQPIVEKMSRSGHLPESYEFYSYAAVQVIAEGIKRSGITPAKAAIAIKQKPVTTVLGNLLFDSKGDVIGTTYVMYRWHDGKFSATE